MVTYLLSLNYNGIQKYSEAESGKQGVDNIVGIRKPATVFEGLEEVTDEDWIQDPKQDDCGDKLDEGFAHN